MQVAENNTLGFGFDFSDCITMGKQASFCQLVNTTDSTPFQVSLIADTNAAFNGFKVITSGTTDGTAADVDDSTATFFDDGVRRWHYLKDVTSGNDFMVNQVLGNETIDLLTGSLASGTDYSITHWIHTGSGTSWDESALTSTIGNNGQVLRYYALKPFQYYAITITVSSYTSGSISVKLGNTTIGTINSAGTHTLYGVADDFEGRIIRFQGDASCSMVLSGMNAYEIDTVGIQIKDTDGNIVDESYDGEYVTYDLFTAQVDYDWSQLEAGCYTMCLVNLRLADDLIADGQFNFNQVVQSGTNTSIVNNTLIDASATFVTNGVQDGTQAWGAMTLLNTSTAKVLQVVGRTNQTTLATETQNPIWTGNGYTVGYWLSAGALAYTITPAGSKLSFSGAGISLAVTNCNLTPGNRYLARFTIDNFAGGGVNFIEFNSSTLSPVSDSSSYDAEGTYEYIFTASPNADFVGFSYGGGLGGDGMDILDFQLYPLPDDSECSECLNIGTHSCSLQITATNDENAFGLNYEDFSLTHSLRLDARLRAPRYPLEAEVYKFSNGQRKLLTGERDKFESLEVREVPEYIHDMLSLFLVHDTMQIDGVTYVKGEGDYEPVWRRTSQLAPIILEVQKGTQNNENPSC